MADRPILLHELDALRKQIGAWRSAGESIGLVPTMGNLHSGHISLLKILAPRVDRLVASVFVNPTQFAAGEDYEQYPRTLEQDAAALRRAGCSLLFAPSVDVMYPAGTEQATSLIAAPDLVQTLCGISRPGHFDGVVTVVARLFNMVLPDRAVFGEKDYQQLLVIRRMVSDLAFQVTIDAAPTVREADGLAMSSRNRYLNADQRRRAPAIYRALCRIVTEIRAGQDDFAELEALAAGQIRDAGLQPEYVAIRRSVDLRQPRVGDNDLRVLAAARAGNARLIDNLAV